MARRDDNIDGGGGGGTACCVEEPPVFVCGLEDGLLDAVRVVALNGFAHECGLLAFVARSSTPSWTC
jgi:hypothetical protein